MKHKKYKPEKEQAVADALNQLIGHAREVDPDVARLLKGIHFKLGEDSRVCFDCPSGADTDTIVKGIRWHTGAAFETKYAVTSPNVVGKPTHRFVMDHCDKEQLHALVEATLPKEPQRQVTGDKSLRGRTHAPAPSMGKF